MTSGLLTDLRDGKIVNFHGIDLIMDEGKICPGDIYLAERNTGAKLLTARIVDPNIIHPIDQIETSLKNKDGSVFKFPEYSYDTRDCVKVKEVKQ